MSDVTETTPRAAPQLEPEIELGRSRRRRSSVQRSELMVLASITVVASVLGALSPGAPTGHPVVDAMYRAVFLGALALAASRARRWSVIVAAAIAAIASVGLGLLFAGVALVMSVFIVGRDVRNRVFGACVGTFLGMACLRLDVGWFLGASALFAAAAAGLVLWSGYRVSRRKTRRMIRWAFIATVVVMVVGLGLSIYQVLSSVSPLESAVRSTTSGVSAVQNGKTADASAKFAAAAEKFRSVTDRSTSWWMFPSRMVPIVGQNIEALTVMSDAGAKLTTAARRTTTEVDYSRIRREGGGVDLALLAEFVDPVVDASAQLAQSAADVEKLRTPWLAQPLAEKLDEFEDRVSDLRSQTDLAATALRFGPALFGGSGERHYLVLLGNPAEARDLGGHIGNWAELSMADGTMSLVEVGRALDLAQPNLENAVQEAVDLPPSFVGMRPATNPQNWGGSLDFPTDAKVAARLYETKTGHRIDGVMYVDPQAMAALLRITGPQQVPGLQRTVTADNAAKFLTVDQFVEFPNGRAADDSLTELVRNVFQKLTTTTLPGPQELGRLFGPLVKAGRLRMVSLVAQDHRLLGRVGLDGGFSSVPGDDVLAVVSRNANPSKIDAYLHRDIGYSVDWDPATGSVRSKVTVTLRNDAPSGGLPRDAIGNSAGLPDGTNISDLAVVTPFELDRATIDGVDAAVTPLLDGKVWRHSVRVWVPPGGTVVVGFDLDGEVEAGPTYHLKFVGQPLVNAGKVAATVNASAGEMIPGRSIVASGSAANVTLGDSGQTLLTLRVR